MKENANSTRRSFLKSGLVLAAPLAAVGPPRVVADDGLKAHLARLEDEAAIGKLHQSWLRQINSGSSDALASMFTAAHGFAFGHAVRNIAADHAGEPDAIAVEPNGKGATGRFHCAIESEDAIPQDCTLARMAHAQGGGFVRRTCRGVLKVEYVKVSSSWTIARVEFASV